MSEVFNRTAEDAVIGGLLIIADPASQVAQEVTAMLIPDDFAIPFNRKVFALIQDSVERNESFETLLIADKAEARYGENLIADLIDAHSSATGTSNLKAYARIVRNKSIERSAITRLTDALDEVRNGEGEITDRIAKADSLLADVASHDSGSSLVSSRDAIREYLNHLEYRFENPGVRGLTTGLTDVDARFNGWNPGELIIIAARPGMGKTTIATQIAAHNALKDEQTLFFSLEMPTAQVMQRMVASVGHVPLAALKDASALGNSDYAHKLTGAMGRIAKASLQIDETGAIDIADLRTRARMAHRKSPVKLILIDYLQLMNDRTERDRFQAVSSVSRKLKALAKELGCVVVALSQLSRKVEERTDKRPISSDLRESGQLEQDADVITMLYRDEVYNEGSERKGIIELITTKYRDGEAGTDFAAFIGSQNRVADLTHMPPPVETKRSKSRGFDL